MLRGACSGIAAAFALVLVFVAGALAGEAGKLNLSGKWSCDDQGTYHIRQIGNKVWWMGKKGKEFTTLFHGTLKGNVITGDWTDVDGENMAVGGTLTLQVTLKKNAVEITKTKQTGQEFGGQVWSLKK